METKKFLVLLAETLEVENRELVLDTELKALPEYGSLSIMSMIAMVDDHFNITVSAKDLGQISTVKDLMLLIGKDKFSE